MKMLEKVITDYYETFLHRRPSPEEINGWLKKHDVLNHAEIAMRFFASEERRAMSKEIESKRTIFFTYSQDGRIFVKNNLLRIYK
jgi:hypothetical protein